ncbi:MAG: ATP-binding protein, partial [Acidimicrobiales bacterium]
ALATTMNELLGRLHEALARQRAFVADAGHELRTPFAVLQAELELASRPGRGRHELESALARASEEAGRLTRLANDLLLLARSDEDQLAARRREVRMESLLLESAHSFSGRTGGAGARCRIEADSSLVALVDPDRIRQAVDNMVDNALRFAPAGSEVVIRATARLAELVIEVTDEGPGFPPDYLPRAFERFARPDSGRTRSDGGTGLGLAIVQAIALAHGGRATARNRTGGGASVVLDLPGAVVAP